MNIYIPLVVYILAMVFLTQGDRKKFTVFAFLALFIVYAFRDATIVGIDAATSYYGDFIYKKYKIIDFKSVNFGLKLLMKFVDALGGNYNIFIIVVSLIVTILYYRLILKYSEDSVVSIFWFIGMLFYTFNFSALKQSVAMAVLCLAYDAIMENKKCKFYFCVVLASIFHFPALVFLPAYWLSNRRESKHNLILLAFMLAVVYVFRSQIVTIMTNIYGGEAEKYQSMDVKFIGTKVLCMIGIIFFAVLYNKDRINDREYKMLLYFIGIATVLQTFCYYNNIFERLADYYWVFSILFIPKIFKSELVSQGDTIYKKNSQGEIIAKILIIIFSIWRFLSAVQNPGSNLLPYYFV